MGYVVALKSSVSKVPKTVSKSGYHYSARTVGFFQLWGRGVRGGESTPVRDKGSRMVA